MDTNLSKKEPNESRRKKLQTCVEILTRWFAKWSAVFPNHPVSKLQTATYAEALIDLTAEQLEYGCKEASKNMEQFPKPGHIRKPAENLTNEYLGPALEWDPELERQRLERKAEWERHLASGEVKQKPEPEPEKPRRPIGATRHAKSLEQQKQELREKGWLH